MQHVTCLCGSRLRTRILQPTNHAIPFSLSSRLGEDEAKPGEDNIRTFRPRSHGNTALPVSALFDPVTVAARYKHKQPKSLPPKDPADLTEFQRELVQNVYAQALATPIRQCVLTKARLPAHFLIPFVTNMPPKEDPSEDRAKTPPGHRKPTLAPRIGYNGSRPSSYLLASHSVVSHLSSPRMRKKHKGGAKWAMLVNERMRKPWAVRMRKTIANTLPAKEWEWDEDMGDVVRRLLGREVLRRMQWCVAQEEELVGGIEDVNVGDRVTVVRISGEEEAEGGNDAYDVRSMLDEASLVELRGILGGADIIALKKHPKTTSAHLALEALKNYVDGNRT